MRKRAPCSISCASVTTTSRRSACCPAPASSICTQRYANCRQCRRGRSRRLRSPTPRIWDEDPRTREATAMFCAMLGTVASNLALTLGARGGIYVAGGIVPTLGPYFAQSEFRARFEAKGRFRGYLAAIPTYVIARPLPALLGATALLKQP